LTSFLVPKIRGLRLCPLAACLALAFDAHAATVHPVTTCADAPVLPVCNGIEDGTLRKAYSCAQDNDVVDLSALQCSKITLSAPLTGAPSHISLYGPGKDKLTIDGAGKFRVLVHSGTTSGRLRVKDLTLTNGVYVNTYSPGFGSGGGCIYSSANVELTRSTVSYCSASATHNIAKGGAIHAMGAVSLVDSTVTGSTLESLASNSEGAGVWGYTVFTEYSTVSGNVASAPSYTLGGGVFATHDLTTIFSTISGNGADIGAGLWGSGVAILESTVSGNYGKTVGGVYAASALVRSSTIARNTGTSPGAAVGLYVLSTYLHLQSSIIANNTVGAVESDIGSYYAATVVGANNLIMAHSSRTQVPGDTIALDPKLGPLQDNGGPTRTLALLPGSPAINRGNNAGVFDFDQRGFDRIVGKSADIGAFESDDIFSDGFNP
jgi:hypothetical protein